MTAREEDLREAYLKAVAEYDEAHARMLEAKDAWGAEACPFSPGDHVVAWGYRYQGEKCVVLKVFGGMDFNRKPIWSVRLGRLKQDGKLGKQQWTTNQKEGQYTRKGWRFEDALNEFNARGGQPFVFTKGKE